MLGDQVLVLPGTYCEWIFMKNGVDVVSQDGPSTTTIDDATTLSAPWPDLGNTPAPDAGTASTDGGAATSDATATPDSTVAPDTLPPPNW